MINAPDLTIRLNVSAWHPAFLYNEDAIIKVRLNDQPAFRIFHEDDSADEKEFWQRGIADQNVVISGEENVRYRTYLREVIFDCADLTGRKLVTGKSTHQRTKNNSTPSLHHADPLMECAQSHA